MIGLSISPSIFPSGEYELIDQLKQVHMLAIEPCIYRMDLVYWTIHNARGILRHKQYLQRLSQASRTWDDTLNLLNPQSSNNRIILLAS